MQHGSWHVTMKHSWLMNTSKSCNEHDSPLQLLHLLLDAATDGAVAEVGVDLRQEIATCTESTRFVVARPDVADVIARIRVSREFEHHGDRQRHLPVARVLLCQHGSSVRCSPMMVGSSSVWFLLAGMIARPRATCETQAESKATRPLRVNKSVAGGDNTGRTAMQQLGAPLSERTQHPGPRAQQRRPSPPSPRRHARNAFA